MPGRPGLPDDAVLTDVPEHPEIWSDLCGSAGTPSVPACSSTPAEGDAPAARLVGPAIVIDQSAEAAADPDWCLSVVDVTGTRTRVLALV